MYRRSLLPALLALPFATRAQTPPWSPDRPVRLLVGFAAGGSTDTTARIIAQAITPALGQSVLVENRTGAGGNIASEAAARAQPDGYTLVMGSMGTHAVNQALFSNLPFHVARDFAPVSLVVLSPVLLVVHPAVPARSVAELIALAKSRPGGLDCGTGAPAPRSTSPRCCSSSRPGSASPRSPSAAGHRPCRNSWPGAST
ncbi:Bug family tripartite tricarboxylate transporter substrate binding protein [Paeniroseomonas aquatica]|uniref:Bug family tripartite tricarboxylate transporter substrate binding protein n=1 Tax=Paeniroseomonas aquatica TaxID=373043 RepID=UPI003614BE76